MGAVLAVERLERHLEEALREARHGDAARVAAHLGRNTLAAQLFERAGEFYEAALLLRDAGQMSRALELAMRVPVDDVSYAAAARLVIELSVAARSLSYDVEQFVTSYVDKPPERAEDVSALFSLGQLYEMNHYLPHAISMYRRIREVDPGHIAVERLRYAEASAQSSATTEVMVSGSDLRTVRKLFREQANLGSAARAIGPGSLLCGRYLLESLLGTGSSGSVFKARDLKLEEYVALKVVDAFQPGSTAEARFRREVSLARRLSHANVVRIYDLAEHETRNFLTMELLEGLDLREHVYTHKVDLNGRRELLLKACAGVGHAHNNRVIHRDIKSENLFVTTQGELKVADFGMAKAPGDVSVTMTGCMGGTPYYMSPEQITDFRAVDHRTDLYALGVVAYELFSGELPFEARALTELLLMHLERPPASMRTIRPELSPELDAIVLKLLAKKPQERYDSCDELASALRAVRL
jgi:eukaryotic-like serine/threonine-protein kinase